MKRSILLLAVLLSWVVLFAPSCNKDEQPPCEANLPEMNFRVVRHSPGFPDLDTRLQYPDYGDTSFFGMNAFVANHDCDTCEWWIGAEATPRYGKVVYVTFLQPLFNLPIKLIAKRRNPCNRNEFLVDTVERRISFRAIDGYSIFGTYRGSWSFSPDVVSELEIMDTTIFLSNNFVVNYWINGFPTNCIFFTGVFLPTGIDLREKILPPGLCESTLPLVYHLKVPNNDHIYYYKDKDSIYALLNVTIREPELTNVVISFKGRKQQ